MKWHGALVAWEQIFRIRHITSGRILGVAGEKQVCLFHKDKADYDSTAFILLSDKVESALDLTKYIGRLVAGREATRPRREGRGRNGSADLKIRRKCSLSTASEK